MIIFNEYYKDNMIIFNEYYKDYHNYRDYRDII